MKSLIENNPYRILGVYVGEPMSKEISNMNKISALAKVSQEADFPMRGDEKLTDLHRTESMALEATQALTLSSDRVMNALFWYADEGHIWTTCLNDAVDCLVEDRLYDALICYEKLIDERLCKAFIDEVTYGLSNVDRKYVIDMLVAAFSFRINSLFSSIESWKSVNVLGGAIFSKFGDVEIKKLQESYDKSSTNIYVLIDNFKGVTSKLIPYIIYARNLYGSNDYRYKKMAESVASDIYAHGHVILTRIGYWVSPDRNPLSITLCKRYIDDIVKYIDDTLSSFELGQDSLLIIRSSSGIYENTLIRMKENCHLMLRKAQARENRSSFLWTCVIIGFILLIFEIY